MTHITSNLYLPICLTADHTPVQYKTCTRSVLFYTSTEYTVVMVIRFFVSRDRCRDYIRLFLDLERPEVGETQRPSFELCGQLSGRQRRFYSSKRSLIVELHTDNWPSNNTGFNATYRFVDKCIYAAINVPEKFLCSIV